MEKVAIFLFSILVSLTVYADTDVMCECDGPVIYAGLGTVAGSAANMKEATNNASLQCKKYRMGTKIKNCTAYRALKKPTVICNCLVGIFDKGLVSGAAGTLQDAFVNALGECENLGLSTQALNGLTSCSIYYEE